MNSARNDQETSSTAGLSTLDEILSFRPWAIECLLGAAWTYTLSSALMLAAPWAVAAATAGAAARWPRRAVDFMAAGCVLLDL